MTLDILFTYLTMDERKEGCEKESSPGSSGNFDKFKWMEILLVIFFLTVKAYVFGDVLHAKNVVQQERPTSKTRWTRRSPITTSSSSTKCLFPHWSSYSCQLQSQSESLCTSKRALGGKKSKYQLEFVELIFLLQYVCGLKSKSCWWI